MDLAFLNAEAEVPLYAALSDVPAGEYTAAHVAFTSTRRGVALRVDYIDAAGSKRFSFMPDTLWRFWRQAQIDALNLAARASDSRLVLHQAGGKQWRLRVDKGEIC